MSADASGDDDDSFGGSRRRRHRGSSHRGFEARSASSGGGAGGGRTSLNPSASSVNRRSQSMTSARIRIGEGMRRGGRGEAGASACASRRSRERNGAPRRTRPGVPMMTHLRQIGRQAPAPQTQGRERLQQRHHGGAARAPRAARGVGARVGRTQQPDRVDDAFDIPRGRVISMSRHEASIGPRKIKRSSDPLVPRGRGHTAPRERTTPCRRVLASDRARGRRRDRELRRARTGRPTEDTTVRSARGRDLRARRCEASARSAGARPSASTGGGEPSARCGAGAFAAREGASGCKECRGSQICEHGRCKPVQVQGSRRRTREGAGPVQGGGGSAICEHGRQQAVQGAGLGHLRAREAAESVQGVRGLEHCEQGGSCARSAGAPRSASTEGANPVQGCGGGNICEHGRRRKQARSAGALRSASTGGGNTAARSAGALASASTGGSDTAARSVARLARRPLG